jgi:hypothetical protein
MIRVTFETLLLFIIPFVVYSIWLKIGQKSTLDPENWSRPLLGLVSAGFILIALFFVATGLFSERHLGAYVPAHVENGQLVPGIFK